MNPSPFPQQTAMTPAAPAFQLERNAFGRLEYTSPEGEHHVGVVPVRAFPIVAPEEGISIVSPEGHELLWIAHLAALPEAQQALLREEFAQREFVPEIRRLKQVSSFSTPSTWEVDTDRGATRLLLNGEEDIRRLSRQSLLITSGDGVQFSVRDLGALDRHSRKLLERFL